MQACLYLLRTSLCPQSETLPLIISVQVFQSIAAQQVEINEEKVRIRPNIKTPRKRCFYGCGGRIRTDGLQVMSLPRFHFSTPRPRDCNAFYLSCQSLPPHIEALYAPNTIRSVVRFDLLKRTKRGRLCEECCRAAISAIPTVPIGARLVGWQTGKGLPLAELLAVHLMFAEPMSEPESPVHPASSTPISDAPRAP